MRYFRYVALLLVAAYLLTGVAQVRPGERAVVRRFGRIVNTPGPGLWIGWPWGIESVERVPVDQVRRVSIGYQPELWDRPEENGLDLPAGQLLTGDHNLVNIHVVIDYAVDSEQLIAFVDQADRADALVARAAEAVLAEWVAGQKVDDVLIRGKIELPRVVVQRTQEQVTTYNLGVQIQGANVAYLLPPDEVKDAFDEVTRAQTSIRTEEHKALQAAERVRRDAQIESYRTQQLTDAYVRERLHVARAEADSFDKRLEQYQRLRRQNPDFLAGIWWEEMGKLFEQLKKEGRIDLLDKHLAGDRLDITVFPPMPEKKKLP